MSRKGKLAIAVRLQLLRGKKSRKRRQPNLTSRRRTIILITHACLYGSMILFNNRAQKFADDLVAFVIMPRPSPQSAKRWLVAPKAKATIYLPTSTTFSQSATSLAILLTYQIIPHLIYRTLRPRKTVREWHPEPPRPVGLVAGLRNSNSFSSVYSISPLLSIPTDLYLGESAVGKVSPSLQSTLPALFRS